jgi:hypothetical protein
MRCLNEQPLTGVRNNANIMENARPGNQEKAHV